MLPNRQDGSLKHSHHTMALNASTYPNTYLSVKFSFKFRGTHSLLLKRETAYVPVFAWKLSLIKSSMQVPKCVSHV